MAGTIGIKQANGNFYTIMEENSAVKKRLILTTVHDNQKSVQIDLYKSINNNMDDAAYIGSIVVEDIEEKPKGEPSIEMVLSSSKDGSISANAIDLANPENKHHLSISLKSLEEDKTEYPDFDLETTKKINNEPASPERKFPWFAIIITGLVLALLCLGLWLFLFNNKNSRAQQPATPLLQEAPPPQEAPLSQAVAVQTETPDPVNAEPQQPATALPQAAPLPTEAPPAEPAREQKPEQKQPVVVEKPPAPQAQLETRTRNTAPVYSFNVPQTIPPEGIAYTIRWGDTLWDISEAFYRNPRLYSFIVRSNNLRNPNLIVPGTPLTILPRT